jgi:RHS repeat-associated protein
MRRNIIAKLFSFLLIAFSMNSAAAKSLKFGVRMHPAPGQVDVSSLGEGVTLLPNGMVLITGGQQKNGSITDTAMIRDPQSGAISKLSSKLNFARAWHSASVLPNGTVLIVGGIGNGGHVVSQAEIFDLQSQTFQLSTIPGLIARAFHTSTLLTDGRLMIAGGVGANAQLLSNIEFWDFRSGSLSTLKIQLNVPRRNHQATLLSDGSVLLSGGKDSAGKALSSGDMFDPKSQAITPISDTQALSLSDGSAVETLATSPEDGATGVALDALISMRFSRPIAIQSINSQTVTLRGPEGTVSAKVSGAEAGMLAFIIPISNLLPGTSYTVAFSGGADEGGSSGGFTRFTFTTTGDSADDDTWTPTSDWMTHRANSKWQELSPLQAPSGVTALAGQVLRLDGNPLPHVALVIGNHKTFTDNTGRFLVRDLPSGHSAMMVLANTANTSTRQYGIYEIGVDIQNRVTNVLRYTIWMTPLDTAHTVTIPSPTLSETVIRSPYMPGLELHIPPHTVITGYDGKVVTQINITPIPLDRPPFPLPNVQVPIYFTIQPGSAYIKVMNTTGPQGARLYYPNAYNYPPGTAYSFWNYDPDQKGWFVYGDGRVSADRSQVIPNPGVAIYEFSGAMVSNPSNAPTNGPVPGNGSSGGDPVDLGTGLFVYSKTDLVVKDVIPLVLTRTYRQNDSTSRSFGIGTNDPYDMFMVGTNNTNPGGGYVWQDLILPDGGRVHFQRISPCTGTNGYCDYANAVYEATTTLTDFFGATLKWQTCAGGAWTMVKKDGTTLCFFDSDGSTNARSAAPIAITDRYGNALTFTRDAYLNLTKITSPNGRYIQFTYDGSNRITQAKDNIGRTVTYSYDSGGRLTHVTDANGGVWNYTYDTVNEMTSIQDPRGIFYLSNQYDANGRVIQQTQADNTNFSFSYTTDPTTGNVTQTDMTDPRGIVKRTAFNPNGLKTNEILAVGKPEQQTITYNHDPNTNLVTSVIDALNRETDYTYDANGNLTSITQLAQTPNAITMSFGYTSQFNELASTADPLNHSTTFQYDSVGNLASITDPLSHQRTFTYNSAGQVAAATDPLQNTTQFSYDTGDLVGITDPLGNSTTRFNDDVGRLIAITNALGRKTKYIYSALDEITQIFDPLQGTTNFAYDPNGNLLSVQDANGNTTTYTYNNHDLVASRTDPLQRTESYSYDTNENLSSFTDRKGQVATYQYDNLSRLNFVGFGTQGNTYASTISYQYDAGNRMTQATDSISGIITRGYDGLDRLTSETTPQGSIRYTYDTASRRATMQVAGQSQVGYTFDNANRLAQIAQGTSTVGFTYDSANRRSTLTLPNGIVATYSYDNDSHLSGISYSLNSNSVGALTYGYDVLGMRNSVSGSFARTGLPQPILSASYDAGNQLLAWNETALSYDANGNMLSDGTHNYAWDARNHLSAIDSGSTGSFVYDPAGRRATKVISGAQTNFLYDLANPVQELSGTTPTANLLTGGLDEYFIRTDSSGARNFLTDALGGTAALTDTNGTIQTQYTFDPYGNTTQSGTSTTNTFAYTGRESDGTGLYFNRARYYSPSLHRFIAQDPIGLGGGVNAYSYVLNNPVSLTDPSGLRWENFWNNPISDYISSHSDYINGICGGGFFLYMGGGPQMGPAYQSTDALWNWNANFNNGKVTGDPVAALGEVGAEVPLDEGLEGEIGYGVVMAGRKNGVRPSEQLLFLGAKQEGSPISGGAFVGASTENGFNPLYNDRYIGLYGQMSNSFMPGSSQFGPQASVGFGAYLTIKPASQCIN